MSLNIILCKNIKNILFFKPPAHNRNVTTIQTIGSVEQNVNQNPERGSYTRRPLEQVTCYKVNTTFYSIVTLIYLVGVR